MSTPSSSDLFPSYQHPASNLLPPVQARAIRSREGRSRSNRHSNALPPLLPRRQGSTSRVLGSGRRSDSDDGNRGIPGSAQHREGVGVDQDRQINRYPSQVPSHRNLLHPQQTSTRNRPLQRLLPSRDLRKDRDALWTRNDGRTSLACLGIFAPRMLETVNIGKYGGFSKLFVERDLTLFPRLTQSLSLQHVQVLVVPASALESFYRSESSTSRFAPGDPILRLQEMIIYMDRGAVSHPYPPSDGYHSEWDEEEDEQGPTFRTFNPQPSVLSLMDPERLVLRRDNPVQSLLDSLQLSMRGDRRQDERMFRITRVGARAMSNWSRLKFIDLLDLDVFVLDPQTLPDNKIARLRDSAVNEDLKAFFLGLGGTKEIKEQMASTNASKEWNVRWFVNGSGAVRPFERGWRSLPMQLVGRDWTLVNERIKSAVIVVGLSSKDAVEAQLAETDEEERVLLKVFIAKV